MTASSAALKSFFPRYSLADFSFPLTKAILIYDSMDFLKDEFWLGMTRVTWDVW